MQKSAILNLNGKNTVNEQLLHIYYKGQSTLFTYTMGQLLSFLMVLGGETSKKSTDLDAIQPTEVDEWALRSSISGVRYGGTQQRP